MCPEGRDEMITHLVVGSHKRTLKVLPALEEPSVIKFCCTSTGKICTHGKAMKSIVGG